jgi:hypothetical protein
MELARQPRSIFRFTKENAGQFSAQAIQRKRELKAIREKELEKARNATPQTERIARQIARMEEMMDKTKDADELQKLSAAHARLFNAWQVLTGTPNPGSSKPSRNREQRQPVQPIQPIVAPAATTDIQVDPSKTGPA